MAGTWQVSTASSAPDACATGAHGHCAARPTSARTTRAPLVPKWPPVMVRAVPGGRAHSTGTGPACRPQPLTAWIRGLGSMAKVDRWEVWQAKTPALSGAAGASAVGSSHTPSGLQPPALSYTQRYQSTSGRRSALAFGTRHAIVTGSDNPRTSTCAPLPTSRIATVTGATASPATAGGPSIRSTSTALAPDVSATAAPSTAGTWTVAVAKPRDVGSRVASARSAWNTPAAVRSRRGRGTHAPAAWAAQTAACPASSSRRRAPEAARGGAAPAYRTAPIASKRRWAVGGAARRPRVALRCSSPRRTRGCSS